MDPSTSAASASLIPLGPSTLQRRSSLLKRNAADAGFENGSGPRKSMPTPTSSTLTLQRRVLTLEAREREQEQKIEEQWEEIERLRGQRKVLLDGETYERETGEEREKEWSAERVAMSGRLKEIRQQNGQLSNSLAQLESEHAQLSNQHSGLSLNTSREIDLLTSRLREVEAERDGLRGWERRARGLSIDLEEARRKAEENRRGQEDEVAEHKMDDTIRKELKRQAQYLVSLERNHAALKTEMIDLRQKRKETDANERATKDVERALRDEIRSLQEQLDRARRDMDSLTQTFPSSTSSPENASILQQRLTMLSNLHNQATIDLAAKDKELCSTHERLSTLAQSTTSLTVTLTKRAEEAERELRWAKEGRQSAERREELAKKEADALRSTASPNMPGGVGPSTGDHAARISQLEGLVDTYKAELESISRDSKDVEAALTQGAGLVKQSTLEEAERRTAQLERDVESLESTISQLTSANTTLDAEVNDLMRRVASGEYNPALERCIELKANPAAKVQAVRTKELDDLRRENEALLDRLKADTGGAEAGVPNASFERLRVEKEELERAHAKRLLRLKEIFGNKSKEFLEAVYSLLGWRIKFDESGADIRLTSMYAPKGKMGLTLKFASQEGHFGTMQMTGAMAKGLEESRHFWIVERQSVPGFLAQVTTEMFEKTTIGRAAGYVGLE